MTREPPPDRPFTSDGVSELDAQGALASVRKTLDDLAAYVSLEPDLDPAVLPSIERAEAALSVVGGELARVAALEAETAAARGALEEEDPARWSFDTLAYIARVILDKHYPADVFDGSSGDPGPVFVARFREALEQVEAALAAGSGGPRATETGGDEA
jgi:hypothetical protein